MKLFIVKDKKSGDRKAFEVIKKQVQTKTNSLIGLAAGKTIDGLYKLISIDAKRNKKLWSRLKVFQIDEHFGVHPNSKLSFNYEIKKKLYELLKVLHTKNIFLLNGVEKPEKTIAKGYNFIKKNNGFDLIILGIGPEYDTHIAYNTTGKSPLNSKMRVVSLHPKIIKRLLEKQETGNRKHEGHSSSFPASCFMSPASLKGITLGVKDILNARKTLLIAYGKEKAKSIRLAFKGRVDTKRASASALQLHKNLTVITDKEAGKYLL